MKPPPASSPQNTHPSHFAALGHGDKPKTVEGGTDGKSRKPISMYGSLPPTPRDLNGASQPYPTPPPRRGRGRFGNPRQPRSLSEDNLSIQHGSQLDSKIPVENLNDMFDTILTYSHDIQNLTEDISALCNHSLGFKTVVIHIYDKTEPFSSMACHGSYDVPYHKNNPSNTIADHPEIAKRIFDSHQNNVRSASVKQLLFRAKFPSAARSIPSDSACITGLSIGRIQGSPQRCWIRLSTNYPHFNLREESRSTLLMFHVNLCRNQNISEVIVDETDNRSILQSHNSYNNHPVNIDTIIDNLLSFANEVNVELQKAQKKAQNSQLQDPLEVIPSKKVASTPPSSAIPVQDQI